MKKRLLLLLIFIHFFAFSQTQNDFKVFLESFRYENKQDTIIMLGKIVQPKEFGCGSAAVEYSGQIHSFASVGNPVRDLSWLKKFKNMVDFPVFWYYLYGSLYNEDESGKEVPVTFKDGNTLKSFLLHTTRLGIGFEKVSRKSVIYHCVFTNIGQSKRTIESYHLLKERNKWKLDRITTQIVERKFDDPYLPNLED